VSPEMYFSTFTDISTSDRQGQFSRGHDENMVVDLEEFTISRFLIVATDKSIRLITIDHTCHFIKFESFLDLVLQIQSDQSL
jgi:hypothetical protein